MGKYAGAGILRSFTGSLNSVKKNPDIHGDLESGKKVLWLHPNLFLFGLCGKMIYSLVRYFFESVLQFC